MEKVLASYLRHICGADAVEEYASMKTRTTMRVGGTTRFFAHVPSKEALMRVISVLKYIEEPYFIIGTGSNIIADDNGFNGVILKLAFSEVLDNECFIYADAGAPLAKVIAFAKNKGLSGLEWAVSIPATIGGAIYMNAGAFGHEIKDVIAMCDVLIGGELRTLSLRELKMGYRTSIFHRHPDYVILGAYFLLTKQDKAQISTREKEYLARRKQSQPCEPSAGSIFKKPRPDFFVGAEIEKLGFKGHQIGGAQISHKHAGFIINTGNASAQDIRKLIQFIKKQIYNAHGVRLQTEVKFLKNPLNKPTKQVR